MKPPLQWLRTIVPVAFLAIFLSPIQRGLHLVDLLARVNQTPDWVFRAVAVSLLSGTAAGLWLLTRRRPDLDDSLVELWVVGLCSATVLGGLGQFSWWLELFTHFRLQYAVGLFAGALYFACRRRGRIAFSAAALAAANFYVVAPQLLAWPPLAADRGDTVRLAMANLHKRNRDAEKVLRFVFREAPDVLLLEEFTSDWQSRLEPSLRSYPHSVVIPREDGHGIALYSRRPILSYEIPRFAGEAFPSIAARIAVLDRPLLIVGAHPPSPRNASLYRVRNRIFAGLAQLSHGSAEPLVVLGDLNSTPWGQSFGRLLEDGGLQDTSRGRGFQWSWPAGFWPLAIPIDHCLTSPGVRIASRRMGPDVGSDHYPLLVDVSLER